MRPEAPILGFDTSAAHCAAGLFWAGRKMPSRYEEMQRGQAERLMPMLEELLTEAGLGWRDLGAIGVGTGPGNFTGIRIAVSAARGLALGLGVPAIGVSSFELQAHGRGDGPLLITLPAPRGQAYIQRFEGGAPVAAPDLIEAGPDESAPYDPGTGSLIAEIAARRLAGATAPLPRPAPHYVRPADAAPMRDAAPVILP
ncbi:MAG TPA: tRNA (adenosine(37)-N6)-threonylcarbamoyltransferase complex dimerization subunit type 1 TsaB [Albidovulum sp.]|nr:tRNA (adenosine(37)-N6)-threonylcarbamoyltransferase complex dimerization subunit type 1 TsaB [Albidovulum sp.]